MSEHPLLAPLNDAQREAVAAAPDPMLVLAGAGSGKTRVLVHRIAWLIEQERISPHGVLAVTFTNKAANEMRGRIEQLLGLPVRGMWVGTFHGLAHRLLRAHWQEAKLPQTFQILDSEDQLRLVKRLIKDNNLDDARWPPQQVRGFINGRKDEGLRPAHLEHYDDPHRRQMIALYQAYEEACQRAGVVDFAELLLRAHELWRDNPDTLAHYQRRFRHVLVDEFQDTNAIQYAWIRLLVGDEGVPFIVGDDDQSIYGWRGARVENIHSFRSDYPAHRLIRLEQNYRSTGTILSAANSLIANNADRLGKNLWTQHGEGEPIQLYAAFNEQDEAQFVIGRIQKWVEEGGARRDIALLYRSNAQSRLFEEKLVANAIPYRVYGGMRFFERQEIKDALAYLRLAANRDDDPSFERVVNTPTRGIGNRTVDLVRELARERGCSLWRAAVELVNGSELTARAANALAAFLKIIDGIEEANRGLPLPECVDNAIAASHLEEHYRKEKGEKGQTRIENLLELVNAARQFERSEDEELDEMSSFLSHAALEAGENQASASDDYVQLMTLHSAKGLEFPMVFLCGVEEGLFPHQMSIEEPGRLEEERRLCYVGMTRAMQQLYISYAESRRIYGRESFAGPSRFVREIPEEFIREVRSRVNVTRPVSFGSSIKPDDVPGGFRLGQRVSHAKFGEGVVLDHEGQGSSARVQVNFASAGRKWLVLSYANLTVL